jgi:hypothetical protein
MTWWIRGIGCGETIGKRPVRAHADIFLVMLALVASIHGSAATVKSWMAVPSTAMTIRRSSEFHHLRGDMGEEARLAPGERQHVRFKA